MEWSETVPPAQRKDLLVKRRVPIREKIRTPKSHHWGLLSFVEDKFVFYTEKVRSIREGDRGVNKNTVALSAEQYEEIIVTMKHGFTGCRPNERIATALMMDGSKSGTTHLGCPEAAVCGHCTGWNAIPFGSYRKKDRKSKNFHGSSGVVPVYPLLLPGSRNSSSSEDLSHNDPDGTEAAEDRV